MFLMCLRVSTFCPSSPRLPRKLCGVFKEKLVGHSGPERHLSCPRVLGVSSADRLTSFRWYLTVLKTTMKTHVLFPVSAGGERWGFPQASTTWALWTGTWLCACSSPGSCATSASGRGWNPQGRWVRSVQPKGHIVENDIWDLFLLFSTCFLLTSQIGCVCLCRWSTSQPPSPTWCWLCCWSEDSPCPALLSASSSTFTQTWDD